MLSLAVGHIGDIKDNFVSILLRPVETLKSI